MAKRKSTKRAGVEDQIRAAIRARVEAGGSLLELWRAAGYADHSQLSRFVAGQRKLTVGAKLDRLLGLLGLELRQKEEI